MGANQTVGQLNIQMNLELAKMQAQIDSANARVAAMAKKAHGDVATMARNMNTALETIGIGLSLTAMIQFGKSILDLGHEIEELSSQAGLSTTAFQKMTEAGLGFGVTGEDVVKMSTKLRLAIQGAEEGNKKFSDDFRALGINVNALKQLAPEQQFEVIGRQIANASDKEHAFREGIDILGAKVGPRLLEFLKALGTEGLDKIASNFDGIRLSPEQIDTLAQGALKLKEIWTYAKLLGAQTMLGTGNFLQEAGKMLAQGEGYDLTALKPKYPNAPAAGRNSTISTAALDAITLPTQQPIDRTMDIAVTAEMADALREKITRAILRQNAASDAGYDAERANFAKLQAEVFKPYDEYLQQLEADGKAMWDETRTPAEKYAATLEEISRLEKAGIIDTDTAARSRKKASEAAGQSVDMEKLWAEETVRIAGNAADNMTTAWVDALNGVEGGFQNLGSVVAREIEAMIVKMMLVIPTMHAIGAAMQAMGMSSGVGSFAGAFLNYGGGKAVGGDVQAGVTYLTGEDGIELFTPKTAGTITPNNKLASLGGKSGDTFAFTYNIPAGVSRADLLPILQAQEKHTLASLRDLRNRGKF